MATPTKKLNAPDGAKTSGNKHISNKRYNEIIARFNSRMAEQGFKGKARQKACLEFYCGAMAAIAAFGYVLPPAMVFPLFRGDEPQSYTSKKGGE